MVTRNVQIPYYQAKIPIRGGGGGGRNIDLTNRPQVNPIVAALEKITAQKRQKEQDELARQQTEANIAYRTKATEVLGQPKARQPAMKIQIGADGTTWLVNTATGEKKCCRISQL